MKTGLILTMGMSPDPLVFSIKETKADYVIFIGTKDSFQVSVDDTVIKSELRPSQYDKIEISDNPAEIGLLCEKIQKAKLWLEQQGVEYIIADPTGGKKWMSAGVTMAASFLGIPMMYIDANYNKNILDKNSMKAVKLGNAYDQTGFVLAAKGRDAFNDNDFEGAANQFASIQPTHAHKKAFFNGLSELCKNLARWDRFEHYGVGISNDIADSIASINSAILSGAGNGDLKNFLKQVEEFKNFIQSIESGNQLNLAFITDIFLNAKRCITRNRFDDAIGRLYRTFESISQYLLLKDFKFDINLPDYSALNPEQEVEFKKVCRDQIIPSKIDLKLGFWLLKVMDHPIKNYTFKGKQDYKSFTLEGILNDRNNSILAHGFKPIGKERAEEFNLKLLELLEGVFGEEFRRIRDKLNLPKMPFLGF